MLTKSFRLYLQTGGHEEKKRKNLIKSKIEIGAFVFDFQGKLEQKEYKLRSTEEDRIIIVDQLNTVSDWLREQDEATPRTLIIFETLLLINDL